MKFCEKLQKLRKEKGYSQEELADLLEVSRQSVSKWESGTTYPEMDKLLSLCKIFGVTLDDLTNDEVSTEKIKEKNQNSFSNLIYTLMEMINKSIEMFKNMSRRDILKCVMEMFILIIFLAVLYLPFDVVNNSISNIFINFPSSTFSVLMSIWMFISNTIYLVLVIAIFLYIYKTRYLDKFNLDEVISSKSDKEVEVEEVVLKEKVANKPKREKQSFIVFDILGAIFNFFVKMFLFFITIPTIFVFVALAIITVLALLIQFMGIHFIGLFIIFLGCSLVCFVVMEILIRLLFSNVIKFKKSFIVFTVGLIILAVGVATTTIEIASVKYIDEAPGNYIPKIQEVTVKMQDNLMISPYMYYYSLDFIEDENLRDDIKVSISYYEEFQTVGADIHDKYLTINNYTSFENFRNIWSLVKENLQDKECFNYNELSKIKVMVYTSSENIQKLKDNRKAFEQEREEINNRYNYYEEIIDSLNDELREKENKINDLEEQVYELKDKLNNIQSQF